VFVEDRLPGAAHVSSSSQAVSWEPHALEFISRLHAVTARASVLTGDVYDRLVDRQLRAIAPHCRGNRQRALRALGEWLRRSLFGRTIPLVRAHGDFTRDNCLYDEAGALCGVIDWELSSGEALPLLDLLQLMDIAGESNAHVRWQRADIVLDAIEGRGPLAAAPPIGRYSTALDLDAASRQALLAMHWVDHVANRIDARVDDAAWMARRFGAPLDRLGAIAERLTPLAPASAAMGQRA
jgi:aminoglycoside phosphotransferase (APT) family kinase protein